MQALTFCGIEKIAFENVPDPSIASPDEVIVEVEVAGLCGSDLHPYSGREKGLDVGTVMGHEFLGRIVDVGSAIRQLGIDDRVVAPFSTSCGDCYFCRSGLTGRCERGELFGWVDGGEGLQGGQAQLVRVPLAESSLLRVPDDVPRDASLLCGDILATGLFSVDLGEVCESRTVAVLGCGPVGLMSILAARFRGAEKILAVDVVEERLRLAETFGAWSIQLNDGQTLERARSMTEGRGVDTVLEVVGSPEATRLAIDLVRPGGTIVATGVHTEKQLAFSPLEAYDKNLTYRAGRCPARVYMAEALELARAEHEAVASIITHRLPLAEGPEAYRMFAERRHGCVKVLFAPQAEQATSF